MTRGGFPPTPRSKQIAKEAALILWLGHLRSRATSPRGNGRMGTNKKLKAERGFASYDAKVLSNPNAQPLSDALRQL